MAENLGRNCVTCEYARTPLDEDKLRCVRYPPRPWTKWVWFDGLPVVFDGMWCGEWKSISHFEGSV